MWHTKKFRQLSIKLQFIIRGQWQLVMQCLEHVKTV